MSPAGESVPLRGLARCDPLLQTEHLTRVVDGRALVEDVSISVERGEMVAIVGPSGSGKSSLLRLLNRLDEPTRGTVYIEGEDYRWIPPRRLRRRVGMLLQRPFLFPGTVAENLAFGPASHDETLAAEVLEQLLERVGLPGRADNNVSRLSGGEAQRVSLARTLANSPEILLLDEPTSGLDEAAQLSIEALICSIVEEGGLTCLLVTHDRAQAARMARRAIVLEAGRVVDSGPIPEITHAD
ncbi:MAG: ATP-binding cassette domain-containing protein [Gemmatimonadota bacterium]